MVEISPTGPVPDRKQERKERLENLERDWRSHSIEIYKESRQVFLSLSGQLVTIAGVFISFSALFIGRTPTSPLAEVKVLILISWVMLGFSLVTGFFLENALNNWLNSLAKYWENLAAATYLARNENRTEADVYRLLKEGTPKFSQHFLFWLQGALFGVGMVSIAAAGVATLYM